MEILKAADMLMHGLNSGNDEFKNTLVDILFDPDRLVATKEVRVSMEQGRPVIEMHLEIY